MPTRLDDLLSVERQTGFAPDALVPRPFPEELAHVWQWFIELGACRGSTGFGALPISFQDIAAWARLTGREPTPFEVQLLRRIDVACLKVE